MLFRPGGQSALTMGVFRGVWRLTGAVGPRARRLAGPLSIVLVMALWIGMLVVGFALIYWPSMPGAFTYASALEPQNEDGFVDALYFSWVTQSTVGFGSIAPAHGAVRMLAGLQATLGFGLLTLVVTWVLSVYPALQRQRAAASTLHALHAAHEDGMPAREMHPGSLARQMEGLSPLLNQVRVDFVQYPSTFYFDAPSRSMGLAHCLPFVAALARSEDTADEARPAAAHLAASLDLLATALADHLGMAGAGTDETLRAYRVHHGLEMADLPS